MISVDHLIFIYCDKNAGVVCMCDFVIILVHYTVYILTLETVNRV